MTSQWKGRMVRLRHMDGGIWQVIATTERAWVVVIPCDETSRNLARLSPDGVVWFRKQDLIEVENPNQGVLL